LLGNAGCKEDNNGKQSPEALRKSVKSIEINGQNIWQAVLSTKTEAHERPRMSDLQ
jgi:hypothetical protein